MSSEGRDRTKQIQKQEVLLPMVRPGGTVHWAYFPEAQSSQLGLIKVTFAPISIFGNHQKK